jgi:hypothetical protein
MTEPPYRAPASLPPDPYVVAWATLRRRRLLRRIAAGVLAYALASTIAVTFMLHGVALLREPLRAVVLGVRHKVVGQTPGCPLDLMNRTGMAGRVVPAAARATSTARMP